MGEEIIKVFISYSWDNDAHKTWVFNLANYLIEEGGCNVILDQYDLKAGGNMTHFMENAVVEADKVLLILTPNYKLKADKRQGGVGMEYSMISNALYTNQTNNTKFIPILREGNSVTSSPTFIQTAIYHDMQEDTKLEASRYDLLRIIYEKPENEKPKRGNIPDFSKSKPTLSVNSPVGNFEKAKGILKAKNLKKELDFLYNSAQGVALVIESARRIYNAIEDNVTVFSKKLDASIQLEKHEDSIRLQTGVYFAFFDYVGYTENRVRLISIRLSAGIDKNYVPFSKSNNVWSVLLREYINKNSLKLFPHFDKNKQVYWTLDDVNFTENAIVEKLFSLLTEVIINEES